ncbi:Zinc finger FYVE domain-containing protein 26 [Collichthys lucidus]|uniref:Zinc finger FYVE domain-containing protein 26 n=1 Tax=Collichthys lucidus TaxID=240159 RepID=A0A4V6AS64_COLLU|nr:Zinc finger FYVE domain-containing protein 26 [Collichthys lucidus]
MHPFGCEAQTSLQDLFEYFKRCLRHGEWELASACVPQLVNSTGGGLSEKLRDIIKAIVCQPYSLKWESVGSPHRLAWFWLQVLEKWTEEQVPPHIRRELEFLLLLEELWSEGIPDTVLKQQLHKAFLDTQTEQKAPERTTDASVESCLRTLLEKKKPRLAQSLAQFLQVRHVLSIKCILDHQHAPSSSSSSSSTSPPGPVMLTGPHSAAHVHPTPDEAAGKPERRFDKVEEWVEEIYAVLSVMPWSFAGVTGSWRRCVRRCGQPETGP